MLVLQRLVKVGFVRVALPIWHSFIDQRKRLARRVKREWLRGRWRSKKVTTRAKSRGDQDSLSAIGVSVINLRGRNDRLAEFGEEMARLGIVGWNRIEAVNGTTQFPELSPFYAGSIGCTLSHIAALESADWTSKKAWMVCEDDAEFLLSRGDLAGLIGSFLADPRLDVLALYGRARGASYQIGPQMRISLGVVGRVCYVVKPHMKSVLVHQFSAGIPLLLKGRRKGKGDQMWRKLQRSRYFFATPALTAVQNRSGYSDIEGRRLGAR